MGSPLAFLPPVLIPTPTQPLHSACLSQGDWSPYNTRLTMLFPCWKFFNSAVFVLSLQWCSILCDPEDCQAPLSMGLSRQGSWSRLPCPSPGCLPGPGIESASLMPSTFAGSSLLAPPGKPKCPQKTIQISSYLWSSMSPALCPSSCDEFYSVPEHPCSLLPLSLC